MMSGQAIILLLHGAAMASASYTVPPLSQDTSSLCPRPRGKGPGAPLSLPGDQVGAGDWLDPGYILAVRSRGSVSIFL